MTSSTQLSAQINYDDFLKVDMRVGRIVEVVDFPKARKPAFKLTIDFGELGMPKLRSCTRKSNYTTS